MKGATVELFDDFVMDVERLLRVVVEEMGCGDPRTFVQCVFLGMGRAEVTSEAYLAVDKIAEGILLLSQMVDGNKALPQRRHPHRYVLKLLEKGAPVHCYPPEITRTSRNTIAIA